jgi:lysophospholipase L1-like esterase
MMAADGFHPGPPAYALWGQAIAQAIRTDFPEAPP